MSTIPGPPDISGWAPGRYPWRVVCRNLEYSGELVVAEAWHPELGQPLGGRDSHFRIVLFNQPVVVPVDAVTEPRAALITPPPGQTRGHGVRETSPSYQIGASTWGQVVTAGPEVDAVALLALPGQEARLEAVARQLMETAYPTLLDTAAFPRPFTGEEARLVFGGLLGRPDASERAAAEAFAPGLGLARPELPHRFDPADCPLFPVIREGLERYHGHWEAPYQELGYRYGLPWPLACLYLLAFVAWGQPPTELRLVPGTAIPLVSGGSLHSVVTASLVASLPWLREMDSYLASLDYSSHAGWNSVLPYARQVAGDAEPAVREEEVAVQEASLLAALSAVAVRIAGARAGLEHLGAPPAPAALYALGRLEALDGCRNYRDFWERVSRDYATPEHLGQDMALHRRLLGLAQVAPEVAAARRYLEGAEVGEANPEMALDRLSLLEQLTPANLLSQDGLWLALESLFRWFRDRYRPLYESHHGHYHRQVGALGYRLEAARPQVEALSRLNSIAELGTPVDPDLPAQYHRLLSQVTPCPSDALDLEAQPRCPVCQLSLAQAPPEAEVATFMRGLEVALRQQQRRLSSRAVRHILARASVAPIDRFLQVVQASDLSSLAQVIDEEVVAFLRQLLGQRPQKP